MSEIEKLFLLPVTGEEGGEVADGEPTEGAAGVEDTQEVGSVEEEPSSYTPDPRFQESFYQRQIQGLTQEIQRMRFQAQQAELAAMEPDDRAMAQLKFKEQELQQRESTLQQQQAVNDWRTYYKSWGVEDNVLQVDDPVQMQHATLTHFAQQLAAANKQIEQLKKTNANVATAKKGEPVTSNAAGPAAQTKTIHETKLSDLEKLWQMAGQGMLRKEDIPPLTHGE